MSLNLDKSHWKRVAFGDAIQNVTERINPAEADVDRYVGLEHLDPGVMTVQRWDSPDVVEGQKLRFRAGDVIFGRRRAYQKKVALAEFDGICSAHALVLRAREDFVSPEFLPVFLSSDQFLERAIAISVGSLSPTVNWRDLKVQEFDLPPLDEQKRIADLLWAVERERRALVNLLNQLDGARSLLRDQLFTELSAETMPFESICSIPSQNGVALKKSERAGNVPMVNMGEMFRDEVIASGGDYERVRPPGDGFLLNEGDLLFARRSIVFEGAGTCCLVPELDQPYTFESSVIRSRVRSDLLDPRFALHFFRSARGRDVMASIVRRGPVSGIAGSDLRKLPVPLPDMEAQKRVITMVEQAGSAAPAVQLRHSAASKLAVALSADAFGGS